MNRTRDYHRTKSYWKAKRKYNIDRDRFPDSIYSFGPWYNNLHQFSKNKIHCSCPLCSAKTRNKGKRKNYSPAINWKISDKKKIEAMLIQLDEIFD